jgi:two-component system, NarL family, response regulator DesR
MIQVLVADDHELITAVLASMINGEPDMRCVARASDGSGAVSGALTGRPDVVVMDVHMPGMNGIAAAARIRSEAPGVKVLMLSGSSDTVWVRAAYAAGAAAYLLKDMQPRQVLEAIRSVHHGQRPTASHTPP